MLSSLDNSYSEEEKEWFFKRVLKTSTCWIWTGYFNSTGYGYMWIKRFKINRLAHRVSWSIANSKPIPKKMYVCHSCDIPSCVNPDHLFLGTPKDNVQDCIRKGRKDVGNKKGSNHPKSVFKEKDIIKIRKLLMNGNKIAPIAKKYRVSYQAIHSIKNRMTWKHI